MADPRRSAGPPASVRVWSPPGPPSRGVTVAVACPTLTTRLPHVLSSDDPAARSVQVEMLVTLAAFRHAGRCGACDLEPVHARGAPWLRAAVDDIVGKAVKRAVRRAARDRHPDARRN